LRSGRDAARRDAHTGDIAMKTARTLGCTLRLVLSAAAAAAPVVLATAAVVAMTACDDENDPKTWVKRLDDPAQRANAIKRLAQFYEDDMTKASNNADAPEVKALLDTIVEPLAKQYTAGGLDEKTRVDLMKFLAETHDPRTQPALVKALKDFEMGRTDDEGRVACESINAMAKSGVKLDPTVVDGLWEMFSKFKLSKAQSERLYHAVHDAVLSVHDPSYGDKAIEKLKGAVTPDVDSQKDQLMWWQLTSVQLLSQMQDTKAVKPLLVALLTPSKTGTLGATIQFALLKMAKAAEPELIKALKGQDPDYAKAMEGFEDKAGLGVVAEVMAQLGRPASRDAILEVLPTADTDTVRTELAQALVQLPDDPRSIPAYLAAYNKLTWESSDKLMSLLKPRAALAQQSANFYDAAMLDWLIKEMKKAPDYSARLLQLEASFKLMTPEHKSDVADAMAKVKKEAPADIYNLTHQMFENAGSALDKCKTDAACYVSILDERIPSSSPTANWKAIKATWMTVIYGGGPKSAATRADLLKHVDGVRNAGARIALCEAIDELAPQGDVAAADALDKIVAADAKSGDKDLIAIDNTVAQVAWRLRVRMQ
jgi:uncharacterized protein (DUF1778 family)